MKLKLLKREFTTVTPNMARHYLKFNDYMSQRPVRDGHVNDLAEKMRNGLFRFGEIAFATGQALEKDAMMNGQHQCHAIIESGISIEAVVEYFECENKMQVSELFRQFEILPRSLKDFVRHEADALGIKWPLWVSSIVVTAAAIDYLGFKGFSASGTGPDAKTPRRKNIPKEYKVKLLENYLEEGQFVYEILTFDGGAPHTKEISHLKRAAVVFFMFETWRVNIKSAYEFWINVRDGENLIKEMPEYRYREFLKTCNQKTYRRISGHTSNHEYIYRGHLAWNAFRQGRTTTMPYRPNADPPKLV